MLIDVRNNGGSFSIKSFVECGKCKKNNIYPSGTPSTSDHRRKSSRALELSPDSYLLRKFQQASVLPGVNYVTIPVTTRGTPCLHRSRKHQQREQRTLRVPLVVTHLQIFTLADYLKRRIYNEMGLLSATTVRVYYTNSDTWCNRCLRSEDVRHFPDREYHRKGTVLCMYFSIRRAKRWR